MAFILLRGDSVAIVRPFRFGVTAAGAADLAAWTALAGRVEGLGYDTLLLPDTLRTPPPLPLLTTAAAVTSRLRVGSWVLCVPLHPLRRLVADATALHRVTGGRLELGLGAGRPDAAAEAEQLGVRWPAAADRVAQVREALRFAREAAPGLPLLVAASGPRLLRIAAEHADTVAFGWAPQTTPDQARALMSPIADADLERATGFIAVGDGAQPWLERMGTSARALAEAGAVTVLHGTAAQMADRVQRLRDELGLSYFTVPASAAEEFAPVAAALASR
jgi:alkanesulfonate monooxygenase SsuD/methylene tetrahydromethanopterin reductase-like flavin-dependent oxidoreductase (luciferase family)